MPAGRTDGAEASLAALPILKCWPADGGSFVTLPMVNTVDPQTGVRNVGMYRMQLFDDRTTGMHWHIHKTGARHYEAWKRAGRRMPVSVALGGRSGLYLCRDGADARQYGRIPGWPGSCVAVP